MNRIALVFAALLLVVFAAPVFAQDPTVVDADHYAVEFENDDVRVLRITYGPGEKSVMHEHPAAIVVMLTAGQMTMHLADGTAEEVDMPEGLAGWTPAVKHMPENTSAEKIVVVLVEMKDDDGDDDHDEHDQDRD